MRLRMFGLAAVLLLAVQTGHAEDKKITIWWAQWDPAAALQELGHEFAEETGIAVEVYQIPWPAYQDQVFLNFGNKQTDFDIVVGDSQWIGRGATKGLYLELTDWLPEAVDVGAIHPRAARYLCEYPPGSSRFFAAPCQTDAIGFVYRKDWFTDPAEQEAFAARYGRPLAAPDTWEEFRDVAEFFHRPEQKRYGCSLLTGRGYDSIVMGFQPFSLGLGRRLGRPAELQGAGPPQHRGGRGRVGVFQVPAAIHARRRHQCRLLLQLRGFFQRLYGHGLGLLSVLSRHCRQHGGPSWLLYGAAPRRPARYLAGRAGL